MDLTGEYEDKQYVVTRGDTRMYLWLPRNEETAKLTRQNRFLIDDPDSPNIMAYQLTKPLKAGFVFNGHGIYKFVLQEVATTDNDNLELMIPDYYLHFPKDPPVDSVENDTHGRRNWL